ncbi:MAG: indolepyruvate ferredoxin oxidoreductase subunit alpha [Acidimicrobiales bacterium]|jgi:ferredoxin
MALRVDETECLGCGACESACPPGAISQTDGFPVAYEVDPLACNDCNRCVPVCPVEGLVPDELWAVCHGRGCPLSSRRYEGWECSEGREHCGICGSMLWRSPGGEWACNACRGAAPGSAHTASCPKVRRATRRAAVA